MSQRSIIVIGGGLAGTAAAHALTRRGYAVTVVEQEDRLGGRIYSMPLGGATAELGACFINNAYANVRRFLHEQHLDHQLFRPTSQTYMLRDKQLHKMAAGTLAGNHLLSQKAKLQLLPLLGEALRAWPRLDIHHLGRLAPYDTLSFAEKLTSPAGQELLEYAFQPVLNGYLYWTPERTSQALLLLLFKMILRHQTSILRGGLQQLPERAAQGSTVLLGHTVSKVTRQNKGLRVTVRHQNTERQLQAEGIVCATTASAVPHIFPDLTTSQGQFFLSIRYSSATLLAQVYPQAAVLPNRAIAFPRRERVPLAAITLAAQPKTGTAVLKVYASGTTAGQLGEQTDKTIARELTETMQPFRADLLKDGTVPTASHVQRWPEALPHFDVGHFQRLAAFANGDIEDPEAKITFAGPLWKVLLAAGKPPPNGLMHSSEASPRVYARTHQN